MSHQSKKTDRNQNRQKPDSYIYYSSPIRAKSAEMTDKYHGKVDLGIIGGVRKSAKELTVKWGGITAGGL